MNYSIYEILQQCNTANNVVVELQKHKDDSILMRWLVQIFDPAHKMSASLGQGFPEKCRLNRDFPIGISDSGMRYEIRKMYIFNESTPLVSNRRIPLFIQLLESLHYTEADLLIAIKDGKFNDEYANITESVVREAFPELLKFLPVVKKSVIIEAVKKEDIVIESLNLPEETISKVVEEVQVKKAGRPPNSLNKPKTKPKSK
jgi:hypothetical protein